MLRRISVVKLYCLVVNPKLVQGTVINTSRLQYNNNSLASKLCHFAGNTFKQHCSFLTLSASYFSNKAKFVQKPLICYCNAIRINSGFLKAPIMNTNLKNQWRKISLDITKFAKVVVSSTYH